MRNLVLNHDYLHHRFYEDEMSVLRWRRLPGESRSERFFNTRFADQIAGTSWKGYRMVIIAVEGEKYRAMAHQILWVLRNGDWPEDGLFLDHIDGDRGNDRPYNHRLVSIQQNALNRLPNKRGSSRFKGVRFYPPTNRWKARLQVGGKRLDLGYHLIEEDAARAYDAAALKHHGEFAKTNAALGLL